MQKNNPGLQLSLNLYYTKAEKYNINNSKFI